MVGSGMLTLFLTVGVWQTRLAMTLLASVPFSAVGWLWYLLLLVAVGLFYLLGNIVLGRQRAGGKRLVLFFASVVFGLFGVVGYLFAFVRPAPLHEFFPALAVCVGSFGLGAFFFALSLFGSRAFIEKTFRAILRGM